MKGAISDKEREHTDSRHSLMRSALERIHATCAPSVKTFLIFQQNNNFFFAVLETEEHVLLKLKCQLLGLDYSVDRKGQHKVRQTLAKFIGKTEITKIL